MRETVTIAKAMAEENRLRVLLALDAGQLCACQITELLGLAPSTVSRHMAILCQAGLVESWKDGRWVHFRLAEGAAQAREAMDWARKWLAPSAQAQADAKRLAEVLSQDKEELCGRLGKCRK
ncbi:transcriptional regulator, ArsR family [Desulfarculus baarsii DSM 2075]|uniref:Transcriptional regulator, ArsR family n=1 Tax=Desulfarculus baarsii (strain ATCC 33931 / DSM 2075 / LMG 7858 / VKM B-1802 / 2st14) TaxID=644282 RepID=E1QKA7_DESB2|nr:metalloregulator ArsR/SmtB family transcription factor [Desulfarculus baarsii]ADK86000.1 transcriptional regulator, ArsR family [Desulfarculus baarsii DSM 2075]